MNDRCVCGSDQTPDHRCMSSGTARLSDVVEAFCSTVDAAVEAFAAVTDKRGGQHVPFHGDFCPGSITPSSLNRLKWWAREMRAAYGKGGR